LSSAQHPEGGWGGASGVVPTVEETALAVRALHGAPDHREALERGLAWLVDRWELGEARDASPIGLYFARLWYHESLYPLIFTVDAFNHRAEGDGPGATLRDHGAPGPV